MDNNINLERKMIHDSVNLTRAIAGLMLTIFIAGCGNSLDVESQKTAPENTFSIDSVAESYVKLVLEVGLYNSDVVDAYYGPEEWRPKPIAEGTAFPHQQLFTRASELSAKMALVDTASNTSLQQARHNMLVKQLTAIASKINMIAGKQYSFDEEARLLYDAQAPTFEWSHFDKVLAELEAKVPGEGPLTQRLTDYRKGFEIPEDKLDLVFRTAISEARNRTKSHIDLPENENFVLEYVTDKPWGGYNYYKGNAQSLIQVNTDFPIPIQRVVDLAAHEGYPGHHVYNLLLEKDLVQEKGWMEFSIVPLFSPQALIAEGSANYGIDVVFPGESRVQYEKEVLFPLAGLDPNDADLYYQILELGSQLSYVSNEVARAYVDGKFSREEAVDYIAKYTLRSPERAESGVKFIENYRSYVINYNVGRQAVDDYMQRKGATADNPERRWEVFTELLSTPNTASSISK
jgi:hypothetical protein